MLWRGPVGGGLVHQHALLSFCFVAFKEIHPFSGKVRSPLQVLRHYTTSVHLHRPDFNPNAKFQLTLNLIWCADELKEAMKESPRRYTNPFLSDEENEKLNLWTQELEHSNTEHDKLRNSLGQLEFCEKETELYTDKNVMECELPELLICYKEGAFHVKDICVDEGIPHGERFLFDENNNETLNAELLRFSTMEDYYMESNMCSGTNVKIDAGLPVVEPSNDHMSIEDNRDEVTEWKSDAFSGTQEVDADLPVVEPSSDHMNIGDKRDEVTERKSDAFSGTHEVDADITVNGPINDHRNTGHTRIDTEIPAQSLHNSVPDDNKRGYKEVSDSVGPNELKEVSKDDSNDGNGISKSAPDRFMFSSESVTVSKATDNNGPDISVQPGEEKINSSDILLDTVSTEKVVSNSGPSLEQDRLLLSLKSLLESIDQQPCQSPVEEISKRPDESENTMEGNTSLNLNNSKPATSSEHVHNIENLEHVDEVYIDPYGAPKLQDLGSDNVANVNMVHRGEGESSFSVAGHVSEHIAYSGPMAFSGSTSLRSESSTTSTRSFAFPILQNEWNSSPVRMAKADRRRLQKHRGWRHGILCCRF
ncbi:hypothetical protein L1987_10911 [Smallanthus sonchifolius]|uniref:Uncharacterized protein n=1 Tax=Smallanthus sonchifolius TaxID=185202 RepID=A0ACB9JCX2_9ASTR|nr:hypothetical protein L1987_10911 [Smallanthus sonchifolius]